MPLLEEILSQPSAPFREGHVIATLTRAFREGGVPHFSDPVGNLVVGARNLAEYRSLVGTKSTEPLRLFIAHMDHPGFHGAGWRRDGKLSIRWLGGSPTAHLEGARVWLSDRGGWRATARLERARLHPGGRMIKDGIVGLSTPGKAREARALFPRGDELFGGFGFKAPVWRQGGLIYTKAADDLVGCYAVASLALRLFGKKARARREPPFLGLLTRAEEVGFIGAIGHFGLGWLARARRPVLAVSLETSRALPGAEIGKGPVVRLGDRFTVFDPGALRVFTELAERRMPGAFQRRIMDGGTCEASAATVHGIQSVGISVPLGNYHNQGLEGGPGSRGPNGPSPEFVHPDDVLGLLALCRALLEPRLPWASPWAGKKRDFAQAMRARRSLLESRP